MRILGLDPGSTRIGVAVSDPSGTFATPVTTLDARDRDRALREIQALCREKEVVRIVLGLPQRTDGRTSKEAELVRTFAAAVEQATGLPVVQWDERFTTAAAERVLLEADLRRQDRRLIRDRVAAQMILQSYLESKVFRDEQSPTDE